MPRFFFHTKDGRLIQDEVGTELPDVKAAQREAIKILCQLLPTLDDAALFEGGYNVTVTSQAGLTLFSFDVTGVLTPAIRTSDLG